MFLPHGLVVAEAHALAVELGLPRWWLNEQASEYIAAGGDPEAPLIFDHPGLWVSTASPEHLLAMKALAARRRDLDDLRFLVRHLGLTSPHQVVELSSRVFPLEPLPDRAKLVLADLFEDDGSAPLP